MDGCRRRCARRTGETAHPDDTGRLRLDRRSWKANAVSETFDNYARDFIGLDTSRFLPALSTVTETVCRQRLKTIVSPIHLPYNEIVRKQIAAYTTTHKALTRRMLTYCRYYFPIFERELEKNGLPLELKFLPVIESALQPTGYIAGPGAVGLWQFTLVTGRYYGLEISSMVDARRDPVASTQAACRYLKDLYDMFDDWTLALASYNYGPGNVIKALKRAGGKASTYWDIYPYLPQATRDYIPALVAMTYLYHYYPDYGITPNDPPIPLATDTVMIDRHLHFGSSGRGARHPRRNDSAAEPPVQTGNHSGHDQALPARAAATRNLPVHRLPERAVRPQRRQRRGASERTEAGGIRTDRRGLQTERTGRHEI